MNSFRRAIFVFGLVITLSGCDEGDSSGDDTEERGDQSQTDLPDACSLLTASEVESLLGTPVSPEPKSASTAGGELRRCSWQVDSTTVLRSDEIVLSVAGAAAYSDDALLNSVPYSIGDEGQLLDQDRGIQIAWKKGAYSADFRYSIIGAFTDDFEPLRVRAKELAQAADGRL
jgi:hypothetical protein